MKKVSLSATKRAFVIRTSRSNPVYGGKAKIPGAEGDREADTQ